MLKKSKGIKGIAILLCMSTALSLTACGSEETGDDYLIVEQTDEAVSYTMGTVVKGDVEKTLRVRCTYEQTKDEDVCFSLSGKKIEKVYVKEGDTVTKGQLLAELVGGGVQDDIDRLNYQIARNKLIQQQTLTAKQDEIDQHQQYYDKYTDKEWTAFAELRDAKEEIEDRYAYTLEDLEDAIKLDEEELEKLKVDLAQSNLYAGMSGTISYIKEDLEGSTCTKDKKVMEIIDSSECLFTVEETDYASYFTDGTAVALNINTGAAAGDYTVYPYQMKDWGDKLLFAPSEEEDIPSIEVGTSGTLRLILDHKEDVLIVPVDAVHTADGKDYVYVLGENNLREVKWISTGLYGDTTVEVTEGLSEGDTVITR